MERDDQPKRDLESRVYQLERDLLGAYSRINELEVNIAALEQVRIARCELHIDVIEEKVDAIGDTLKDLISDLIRENAEREKTLPTSRKIRIIRRQRLPFLSQEMVMSDGKEEE